MVLMLRGCTVLRGDEGSLWQRLNVPEAGDDY